MSVNTALVHVSSFQNELNMAPKILSEVTLRNFTIKVTNLVTSFCFITRLFNLPNSNKKRKEGTIQ